MIKIYFDEEYQSDETYIAFSYKYKPFEKEFYLGAVASIEASLTIPKDALPSTLDEVTVKIDNNNYLSLIVDEININDNDEAVISLVDYLVRTNTPFDFSDYVPITAKSLLELICDSFGIDHDTFSFTNDSVTISSFDNTLTARQYISMIAELAGGYAYIDASGKLQIATYLPENTTTNVINSSNVDEYKLGENITIQRVVYEGLGQYYASDDDNTKYTLYLDTNNLFLQVITRTQFNAICANIIGFTFNNIKINTCKDFFVNRNIIKFLGLDNNTYYILNQCEASYGGGFVGSYQSEINNSKQSFTQNIDNTDYRIKRITQIINQDEARLDIIAQDLGTTKLSVTDQGLMIDCLANNSNIDVEYDANGNPINGTVRKVTTSTGFTFDESGLEISQEGQPFKAKHTITGTEYYDGNKVVGQYTKDGSKQLDLYLFGTYKYGMDDINDTPMFVASKFKDGNEDAFGHFYNRGD